MAKVIRLEDHGNARQDQQTGHGRFYALMEEIKGHPAEWANTAEGAAIIKRAVDLAPPDFRAEIDRQIRHDELIREIFARRELDPEWIHTVEGCEMLAEALTLAPPEIKAQMDAKLKELGLMPEVQFVDDGGNPVFTMEQMAETFGVTVDEIRERCEELSKHHPGDLRTAGAGPIHRVH